MTALVTARFADRIALVTGAANGIGRASALRLAREGADLVVVDREGDTLQGVAREIEAVGRRVLPITADWTDPGAVEAAFAAIRQRRRTPALQQRPPARARHRAPPLAKATWRSRHRVSAGRPCGPPGRGRGDAGQRSGRTNMSTESAFYGDGPLDSRGGQGWRHLLLRASWRRSTSTSTVWARSAPAPHRRREGRHRQGAHQRRWLRGRARGRPGGRVPGQRRRQHHSQSILIDGAADDLIPHSPLP